MLACFRAVEGIVPMHAGHDHSSDTGAASGAPAASSNSSVLISLPNDPLFGKQWYLHNIGQTGGPSGIDIKAVAAWQKVFSSKAITVAVVDSGVDVAHPDLKDQIWINTREIPGNGIDDEGNGYIDDINGWNFFQGNNLPADLDGHGTHVAGTIGASNNNNIGITGIAWGSPLMAVKVLPSEEERIDTPGEANAIAYGIRYAADNGAKIINLSLGSDTDDLELREAVIYAASKGALLITAAGNDNKSDEKSIGWPSNYNMFVPNNLINIGSTNELGLKSGFSNFGDSVDLLAPGGKGDPDERPNGSAADIYSTEKGTYQYSFGTSMATPVVSGSAALVWSLNPAWNAETVIKILIESARVTPELSAYAKQGRQLDLDAAITYARNLLGTQITDYSYSLSKLSGLISPNSLIGAFENYQFYNLGGNRQGIQKKGTSAIDEITGISTLTFKDSRISVSDNIIGVFNQVTGKDTKDAQIFRLYNASFNRFPDSDGLKYWINEYSKGITDYKNIAESFIISNEFKQRYGATNTNLEFATNMYKNILGRLPDADGLNYWVSNLNAGTNSRVDVLGGFSESIENKNLFSQVTGFI